MALHATNGSRAGDARRAVPPAEGVVVGDLAAISGMRRVAEAANGTGRYDTAAHDTGFQNQLMDYCASLTGVPLPAGAAPAR